MQTPLFTISLPWKETPVNLAMVEVALRGNHGSKYVGSCAHAQLELYFREELSSQETSEIESYWADLNEESIECVSYKSQAEIEAEQKAEAEELKSSGKAKLLQLGLTEEEVKALLGQ